MDNLSIDVIEMINVLREKDLDTIEQVFPLGKLELNVNPEVMEKAKSIYEMNYSTPDFETFYKEYRKSQTLEQEPQSVICKNFAFDPMNQRLMSVTPRRKKKLPQFNIIDFLTDKNVTPLSLQFQLDDYLEDDLYVLQSEEKKKLDFETDRDLRRMADNVDALNRACNYRILDVHYERSIR